MLDIFKLGITFFKYCGKIGFISSSKVAFNKISGKENIHLQKVYTDSELWYAEYKKRKQKKDNGNLPANMILDPGSSLTENATSDIQTAMAKNPDAKIFYGDEIFYKDGEVKDIYLRPDFNYDFLLSNNYIGGCYAYRPEVSDLITDEPWQTYLKVYEKYGEKAFCHISEPLTQSDFDKNHGRYINIPAQKQEEAVLLVQEHLKNMNQAADILIENGRVRVKYTVPENPPLASIIILTKDKLNYLQPLVESIYTKTTYPNYEVIIVNNNSEEQATLDYLSKVEKQHENLTIIHDPRQFNFSALNNSAARTAKGEVIVLLNNDMKIISEEWLTELVTNAIRPGVAAVGAKLLFANNTIQHAGVVISLNVKPTIAWHVHAKENKDAIGYNGTLVSPYNYMAVTGACLAVRKSIYFEVGCLNEKNLAVGLNDVDFCLKCVEAGYRNLFTPYAKLYHYESASRGKDNTFKKLMRAEQEREYMLDNWGKKILIDTSFHKYRSHFVHGLTI